MYDYNIILKITKQLPICILKSTNNQEKAKVCVSGGYSLRKEEVNHNGWYFVKAAYILFLEFKFLKRNVERQFNFLIHVGNVERRLSSSVSTLNCLDIQNHRDVRDLNYSLEGLAW